MFIHQSMNSFFIHPVSYTHLDVYKRQARSSAKANTRAVRPWSSIFSFVSKDVDSSIRFGLPQSTDGHVVSALGPFHTDDDFQK